MKVRKVAEIRNRYNQAPHLTQDIKKPHGKVNKTQLNITNESQQVSTFPAGDHKAAMNRRESMTNTNDPQKKYRNGTVSKIFYWRA